MDMKRIMFASVCTAGLLLFTVSQAAAQADIEIGKTTIRLQSPVKIYGQDKNVYRYDDYGTRRKKNRWYDDASVFFGFSFPVEGCSYEPTAAMPVKYGNSFEITLGAKQWFGIGHYAFGISAQYTHYDYRGSGLAARGIIAQYPHNAVISREIFKTDNFGIGVYNRFYISLRTPMYIDLVPGETGPSAGSTRSSTIWGITRRWTITGTGKSSCLCRGESMRLLE